MVDIEEFMAGMQALMGGESADPEQMAEMRQVFAYESRIAGALMVCSFGGIGAAKGGIPSNFKFISTGFFPESLI